MLQLFTRRSDKHISHEERVVSTSTDDSDSNPVFLIPASVTIDNINSGSGVEVVDCTFSVDFPYLILRVSISH